MEQSYTWASLVTFVSNGKAVETMSCAELLVAGMLSLSSAVATTQLAAPSVYLSEKEIAEIKKGTGCRNLVRQFFALQKRMGEKSLVTDYYDLKILPTDELVAGRKGKYYAVYLKDATKRARFSFPGGLYIVKDFKTRFRRSFTAFVRDVLATIEGGAEYDIFVRGSGSSTPMATKRTLVKDAEFTRIAYLPKIDAEKYGAEAPKVHTVPIQYANGDLPFLRAAFLQDTVQKFYPLKKPIVLQSDVAETKDKTAQFAELILFIDW